MKCQELIKYLSKYGYLMISDVYDFGRFANVGLGLPHTQPAVQYPAMVRVRGTPGTHEIECVTLQDCDDVKAALPGTTHSVPVMYTFVVDGNPMMAVLFEDAATATLTKVAEWLAVLQKSIPIYHFTTAATIFDELRKAAGEWVGNGAVHWWTPVYIVFKCYDTGPTFTAPYLVRAECSEVVVAPDFVARRRCYNALVVSYTRLGADAAVSWDELNELAKPEPFPNSVLS